ncbi:MAG: peroxiredoxin family protein [Gammaproteobacteria bacterium]
MKIKSAVSTFLALALIAAGILFWQTQTVRNAPSVTFKTIKGENINMKALQGKPTLVTFWATDCPGCIEEIPHLIDLHRQYADKSLRIIAVAMHYDPPNHVLAMAESKQLPYAIALDPSAELARAFGNVQLTPTTFLIDQAGKIVFQKLGVFDPMDMQNRLESLLHASDPVTTSPNTSS